jgi:hypothetical protein
MHNDMAYMISLAERKRKLAEQDRNGWKLTELRTLERKPGLIRRSLTAFMNWTRATGRRSVAQPVDSGFPAVRSDAAERAALRRTPYEQFRLHDV